MLSLTIDFINLLLSALLVGALFCVWMLLNPAHLDASHYIILQQQGIRTLHPSMPRLGALTIAVTLMAAFLARENKPRMSLLIAAAVLFTVSGVITRVVNMPINASVIHWSPGAPPEDWSQLRDEWWRWHCRRTLSAVAALVLVLLAALTRNTTSVPGSAGILACRPVLNALLRAVSSFI
jgi:uncharacterized membrane protein